MKTLSDTELLKILTFKVQAEKRLIAEIIDYVKEIDRRRLYFKLGYSSLFEFMTKELGYTAGSAQRRIDAARLLNELPEIKESLKLGEHNLMQISMLARASREKAISTEEKREVLEAIKSKDLEASEQTVAQMLDIPIKVKETKRIQKDESVRLEITLSKEQMDLYNQVKSQMSHINPNPTFAEVFEYLARKSLKQPKTRTAKVAVKKSQTRSSPNKKRTHERATSLPMEDEQPHLREYPPAADRSHQTDLGWRHVRKSQPPGPVLRAQSVPVSVAGRAEVGRFNSRRRIRFS